MTVDVHIDALEQLDDFIRRAVADRVKEIKRPRWYTLKAACEYKGVSYNTVKCSAILQPGCGKPDAIINGRKMWRAESVEEWVEVTDENIEEYISRCRKIGEYIARCRGQAN